MDVDGEPGTTRATIGVVNTQLAADRAVVLVVEDDPHIAELLDSYLRQDGYRPVAATDGEQAIALFHERCPSLVLLDLGLPGGVDGVEVCRRLRRSSDVPIIMLTARSDEVDRVLGFEVGTDDYVMKPFSPRELMGRVRAVLRRSAGSTPAASHTGVHAFGAIRVDGRRRHVTVDGTEVPLAAREFGLLWHLVRHTGQALSRRQILDGAWEDGWIGDERTVDVHVRQLRRKLGDDLPLATVRGHGYRLG